MKQTRNVHSVDTLEAEINRLKLKAKEIEEKLDKNLDHFQENYWLMTMNSLFRRDDKKNDENDSWKNFFKFKDLNAAVNRIAEDIADKVSESLHNWMNRFNEKNKH